MSVKSRMLHDYICFWTGLSEINWNNKKKRCWYLSQSVQSQNNADTQCWDPFFFFSHLERKQAVWWSWTYAPFLASHDAFWPTCEFPPTKAENKMSRVVPHENSDPSSCTEITLGFVSDDPSTSTNERWRGRRRSPRQYAHLLVHEWISHRVLFGMCTEDIWLYREILAIYMDHNYFFVQGLKEGRKKASDWAKPHHKWEKRTFFYFLVTPCNGNVNQVYMQWGEYLSFCICVNKWSWEQNVARKYSVVYWKFQTQTFCKFMWFILQVALEGIKEHVSHGFCTSVIKHIINCIRPK